MTVCSGVYVIDVTDRFVLNRGYEAVGYYHLWIMVGTTNSMFMFICCVAIRLRILYIYTMSVGPTRNTRLSTLVSMFDSLFVDTFLYPSCDISHVALDGVPLLCMSSGCG